MKKLIDIPEEILPDLAKYAMKNKKKPKDGISNYIVAIVIEHLEWLRRADK